MVGDAVHNLRAALDYLTWQLAIRNLGREPRPHERSSIQFPIALSESAFPGRHGNHISCEDLAVIERFQPYHRRYPERHPLAVLREISNEDKHRLPQVTVAILDWTDWTLRCVSGGVLENVQRRRNLPMEHGATAATFEVRRLGEPLPQMDTSGTPAFYPALASGHFAWGSERSVVGTLRIIGEFVVKVLEPLRPQLRSQDCQRPVDPQT